MFFAYPFLKLIKNGSGIKINTLFQHHRECNLSDFHEMATHMRMQEERSLLMENHAYMVDTDGRRSGIGNRQFSYSGHLAENRVGFDLTILSERKTDNKSHT
jgi:hypothetical protein